MRKQNYPHPSRVTPTGPYHVTGVQPQSPELQDIENKALDQEERINYLSGVHQLPTDENSPYQELRNKGYSDLAVRYILYKNDDLLPDEEDYDLTGSELDETIEKELGGVFYKNYSDGWELGRLDRISGSSPEIDIQSLKTLPGAMDGYVEGKQGIPKKSPTVYYAVKLKERLIKEGITQDDKEELKRYVRNVVERELKGRESKKFIEKTIKEAITNLYKTLWLRRATWLSGI